jgi:Swi5-dependent recombination DNA repair protein 1
MATPAPKRRRLHQDSNSALHKPFKSPFRTPQKVDSNPASEDSKTPAAKASKLSQTTSFEGSVLSSPSHVSTATVGPTYSPHIARQGPKPLPRPKLSGQDLRQLSQLRQTLTTLRQAHALLLEPSKDAHLEDLIHKWKAVSRSAAEELFSMSRYRVDGMGGLSGRQENERQRTKRSEHWDDYGFEEDEDRIDKSEEEEEEEDNNDDDDQDEGADEEEKERRKEQRREAKRKDREERRWNYAEVTREMGYREKQYGHQIVLADDEEVCTLLRTMKPSRKTSRLLTKYSPLLWPRCYGPSIST